MCRADESVARIRDCGERAWTRVGASMPLLALCMLEFQYICLCTDNAYGSKGTAIFAITCPVMVSAILTMPSVPDEYK